MALKNLLCELYLHNLVVLNDTKWNQVLYVGDVQLREAMSWIQNEISREHQATPYRDNEITIPLFMRSKVQHSR